MIYLLALSLVIGAAYGWMFYAAVMNRTAWCAIMWAAALGLWQANKFYNSDIVRSFIKVFVGE